jgi:outer membrane murein-binding lipoprotein Lpp
MKFYKIAAISILAISLVGCASSKRVEILESKVAAQASLIEQANNAGRAAALQAQEAKTCCAANGEKIDRMFKASMVK